MPEGRWGGRAGARAGDAFRYLSVLAARGGTVFYADFAFDLGLGAPRGTGFLLRPLLGWCTAEDLPPLPILVVRRRDGLPSGPYRPDAIATETARVHTYHWAAVTPPTAAALLPFAGFR